MKTFISAIIFFALILLSSCSTLTPMNTAIGKGDINEVKKLADTGASLYESADCGSGMMSTISATPLQCAVWFDQPDIINLLIDKGVDPSENSYGSTPLSLAASYGINKSAKVLLERGADPNAGKPLSSAAFKGNIELMKMLIAKGADIDTAIEDLKTWYDSWLPDRNKKIDSAIRLLEKQKPKQEMAVQPVVAPQPIQTQSFTKEDIAGIVQAAVDKATAKGKEAKSGAGLQNDMGKLEITASEKVFGDKDLAVIIGIEGYKNLPKSDYSYDDAFLFKEYLKALGIKERNIEFLTDDNASLSAIIKSVEAWLKNKAKNESRIFFYYSGHGAPDPAASEAYLVPYDGDPNYISVTGYPLKRLYQKLSAISSSEIIIVLDACFSGSGGRSVLAKGARPLIMLPAALPVSQNMAVLTATQGSQISSSSQEKGHGLFTYYFLKAIKEGKKNVADIYEYIKPLVEDDAKAINVQQSPSINPDIEKLRGRFVLRK